MKQKLEQQWYRVVIPWFPTPENQSLASWSEIFSQYLDDIDEQTIFIAHSVWPSFVCDVLEKLSVRVQTCYFVSWFLWYIGLHEFDRLNASFVDRDFNWKKIRENSERFYMCHGANDPYVPQENAEDLARNIGVEIDYIENGGHLNSESWYTEFEYLLDRIVEWEK